MSKQFKPVHLIHLLLYAPTNSDGFATPIFGRTRLMKMLFIFEKELAKKFENDEKINDFGFEAYHFGPYSRKVYEAIDFLESREIIEIRHTPPYYASQSDIDIDRVYMDSEAQKTDFLNNGVTWNEEFCLIKRGIKMMKEPGTWFSWVNLSKERQETLTQFKTVMVNTPLRDILKYVYSKYPKYAEKSTIRHRIFPGGV